ncbi:MAG TPA: metabolite traffic protein EboE [Polyangiales bacterium]|nr:metabolite traffic protein EboE [Polyangiales bacterium]
MRVNGTAAASSGSRQPAQAAQHLTYCTNIHPGESLPEVRAALAEFVPKVKAQVAPSQPFGVGLRLSQLAAAQLTAAGQVAELRDWLEQRGLYVFTLNGFPYGAFHGTRVKERVYEPDWRTASRVEYTAQLAAALAGLLPEGVAGSISTVPGAWKASVASADELASMGEHVLQSAAGLVKIWQATGREISLALEPEPGCVLETIDEAVGFFGAYLFSERAIARFAALTGLSRAEAASRARVHLGLCLDACHAAVEFEDPKQLLATLDRAGVEVKKLQISSGLRVPRVDSAAREALAAFEDDTYLHQTVERRADVLTRYRDLPEAIAAARFDGESEWRIHFHVPVFLERYGVLESTQGFLRELLQLHRERPISAHLEVETYTWDVLPADLRAQEVTAAISRELQFVIAELSGPSR